MKPDPRNVIIDTYMVYWDSECQCEITRFEGPFYNYKEGMPPERTQEYEEWLDLTDMFGGGNYNFYHCMKGWHIVSVTPRSWEGEGTKMAITIEEDELLCL